MDTLTTPPPTDRAWREWRDTLAGEAGRSLGPAKVIAGLLEVSPRWVHYWQRARRRAEPQQLFEALDRKLWSFIGAIMRGADPRFRVDPIRFLWSCVRLYLIRVVQQWSDEELEEARLLACARVQLRVAELMPWQLAVRSNPDDEEGHRRLAIHGLSLGWAAARLSAISCEILRRREVSPC